MSNDHLVSLQSVIDSVGKLLVQTFEPRVLEHILSDAYDQQMVDALSLLYFLGK